MKTCGPMVFLLLPLLCSSVSVRAARLGSPHRVIQQNFNRLLTSNACPGCDLRGAVMNHLNLSGADLQGANLTGAQFNFADLSKATLRNADLHGAWFIGADLSATDLRGTILQGMDKSRWANTAGLPDTATARPSVDEIPVIEADLTPDKTQKICFWHYLFGLDIRQSAGNQSAPPACLIPCALPKAAESAKDK